MTVFVKDSGSLYIGSREEGHGGFFTETKGTGKDFAGKGMSRRAANPHPYIPWKDFHGDSPVTLRLPAATLAAQAGPPHHSLMLSPRRLTLRFCKETPMPLFT